MFFISQPIGDYQAGFFSASFIAEEYVNIPAKPPMLMPNHPYGLEEYFETRITTAVIAGTNMKDYFKDKPEYMRGHWDGFLNFVKAFRHFKVKTLQELEQKVLQQMRDQSMDQDRQRNDIGDADWWKHGKKPWDK